jgi:hypothetical protein
VSIAGSVAATAMHAEQTTEVPAVEIFTHMVITFLAAAVYRVHLCRGPDGTRRTVRQPT